MFVGIFGDGWTNLERDRYGVSSAILNQLVNLSISTNM